MSCFITFFLLLHRVEPYLVLVECIEHLCILKDALPNNSDKLILIFPANGEVLEHIKLRILLVICIEDLLRNFSETEHLLLSEANIMARRTGKHIGALLNLLVDSLGVVVDGFVDLV